MNKVKSQIQSAKHTLTKEFMDKKDMILRKINELKKSNKNIEEIYKYTSEIIMEEENEEEEDDPLKRGKVLESQRSRSVANVGKKNYKLQTRKNN